MARYRLCCMEGCEGLTRGMYCRAHYLALARRYKRKKRERVSLALDYPTRLSLIRTAGRHHCTMAEMIRTYIEWGLEIDD